MATVLRFSGNDVAIPDFFRSKADIAHYSLEKEEKGACPLFS
jgi:hypothetical protein